MEVLTVLNRKKEGDFTYSIMGVDKPKYLHINNDKTGSNSVIVPISVVSELINKRG